MSFQNELNLLVSDVEQAVTYYDEPHEQLGFLDLGSADLRVIRQSEKVSLTIMTSSGHAVTIPADLIARLR